MNTHIPVETAGSESATRRFDFGHVRETSSAGGTTEIIRAAADTIVAAR